MVTVQKERFNKGVSRQELLQAVKASPAAVADHDKTAWLSLFSAVGLVNDPVGSRPHRGEAALGRFYETFIAPNEIHFEIHNDWVCGMTVVRDVTIHIRMPTGQAVSVPAHIRYEMTEEQGAPRIAGLFAHWELMPMVTGTLSSGFKGVVSYARLSVRMLACQGLGGMLGFVRGFTGVGRRGKRQAEKLLAALSQGDVETAGAVLSANARVEAPAGTTRTPAEAGEWLQGLNWSKLIAAGPTVTASVEVRHTTGAVLLSFLGRRIERVVFYIEDAHAFADSDS